VSNPADVSVIVPVYNAMPYLTDCLGSLVAQSIGAARMELIVVDDGSTDGSRKEIDRFAAMHPRLFTVLHQANSGGPGRPCNRGLFMANGRYVYFVGADDYIWSEALERLVAEADEYGSEVVAGKMVGVNGRYVHQAFYARTDHDVSLFASDLPWSMSNAKLFRRELIGRLRLRFPEDLPVNSDQPFTLEACLHARRISVLTDDSYYFARLRPDAGNITYRTRPEVNLACATDVMHRVAKLIEAGWQRDAILRRLFAWELVKVLRTQTLDSDTWRRLCRGVAELADEYLTDNIRDGLGVHQRLLLCLAQRGDLDLLRDVIREQAEHSARPLFLERDRAYVMHSGFRCKRGLDDRYYEILTESVSRRLTKTLELTALSWRGRGRSSELCVTIRVALTGPDSTDATRFRVRPVRNGTPPRATAAPPTMSADAVTSGVVARIEPADDGLATIVHARIPISAMRARWGGKWAVALCVNVAGRPYELPLPSEPLVSRLVYWQLGIPFRLSATATTSGRRLQLVVGPGAWCMAFGRPLRSFARRVGRR
jgi:poly(ribitol-phosphate) beta-N-acetylglucosaminyltransferase